MAYPQAENKKDFFAWAGSPYPGTVYKVFANGGVWTDTGEVPTQEEIDLSEYAKNGGRLKRFKVWIIKRRPIYQSQTISMITTMRPPANQYKPTHAW